MKNLRPFQIFLLVIFGILGFLAVILLSNYSPDSDIESAAYGSQVVVWGSLPSEVFNEVFQEIRKVDDNFRVVRYVEVDSRSFNEDLVNAIAEGRSPDLILLPHEQLVSLRAKLLPIPYETISERDFRDQYVDGADIFALSDGIHAIPFAVDPLMLYWNRDLFAGAGLAGAPTTWQAVVGQVVPGITRRDTRRNILQSAIAFGEFRNIRNAPAIMSLLLLQSGSRMVEEGERGYVVALDESLIQGGRPLETAVKFFVDFSNASSPAYSWNRSQPADRDAFIAGDLAMYFGYGSEVEVLSDRNPNLNFDIAPVPQGASATTKRTYGTFYGYAIPRAAGNRNGGYATANRLSQPDVAIAITDGLRMAPVQRALVARGSDNFFQSVVYESALITRGWLTPNPAATAGILQIMVEDVVSNRARVSEAVNDAVNRITLIF